MAIVAALGAVGAGVAIFGTGGSGESKPADKTDEAGAAKVAEKFTEKKEEVEPEVNGIPLAEREKINQILAFWYPGNWDRHSSVPADMRERWFTGGAVHDRDITDKFAGELRALDQDEREHWVNDRDGLLAYVILADQFSRNIFRGDVKSFSFDARGLKAARLAHEPARWTDYKS